MAQFRSRGWDPTELKVYWDVKQLEDLCPKDRIEQTKEEKFSEVKSEHEEMKVGSRGEFDTEDRRATTSKLFLHDPSDADAVHALRQYPVSRRNHAGEITYVNKGIEKAVFDAPADVQLIVLNFAVNNCCESSSRLYLPALE
jgi:hypothetical protein